MSINAISFQARHKFMEHYSKCCDILNSANVEISPPISLELYAAMYIISDYAAFGYQTYHRIISDAVLSKILPILSMTYPQFTSDIFRKRIMFYTEVVSGLELHAHGLMGEDVSDVHPVLRCAVAFSDCCLHPTYIKDYNAPRPMLSAIEVMGFSIDVMDPLYNEFASLFKDICDICETPAMDQNTNLKSPAETSAQTPKSAEVNNINWLAWIGIPIAVFVFLYLFLWGATF